MREETLDQEAMSYPFIRARHFTPASRGRADIDVIVLHTMEFPGGSGRRRARRPVLPDDES